MFSTSTEIPLVKHVHTHTSAYTCHFQTTQGLQDIRPQSTALITTIKYIHILTASVIASSYTEETFTKGKA